MHRRHIKESTRREYQKQSNVVIQLSLLLGLHEELQPHKRRNISQRRRHRKRQDVLRCGIFALKLSLLLSLSQDCTKSHTCGNLMHQNCQEDKGTQRIALALLKHDAVVQGGT